VKILVAEDDDLSRLLLTAALEKLGHTCIATVDGSQAWQTFAVETSDVVISDWVMPGLSGIELCRRIRAHNQATASYTYFIVLTALADKVHMTEAMAEGADDFLPKPLDHIDLRVRLRVAERFTVLYQQLTTRQAELAQLNQKLYEQAHQDPLTGLANRLQLRLDLDTYQAEAANGAHTSCIAMCDIDFFKKYNDHYGHVAGDGVLQAVATCLKASCRQSDSVYRYGGEEFLIIYSGQDRHAVSIAAQRVCAAVRALAIPHAGKSADGVVTISIGLAEWQHGKSSSVSDALRAADAALYQAKARGRNRVVLAGSADDLALN
jgi:diguanylate cyclase (GGDEF)-like protein